MPFVYSYPTSLPAGQSAPSQAHTLRGYSAWNETWDQQAPVPQLMAVPLMTPAESTASFLNNTRMTFQNWVPRVSVPAGTNSNQTGRALSSTALPGASVAAAHHHQQHSAAVAHAVPGSNVPVVVNPDFDLMVEFGVFDSLPLVDLSPRQGQLHGFHHDHDHAHAQDHASMVPLPQQASRALLGSSSAPAHPAVAAVHCTADADTVTSAVSSIESGSPHHYQQQQQQSAQAPATHSGAGSGVDACCMTDITYSEALQAFIRRENTV